MDSKKFIDICKEAVIAYANENLEKTDQSKITEEDVFVVWSCKTLQNNKALLSTTISDGMYYELTYNGDKSEVYLDAYKKWENKCIKVQLTLGFLFCLSIDDFKSYGKCKHLSTLKDMEGEIFDER